MLDCDWPGVWCAWDQSGALISPSEVKNLGGDFDSASVYHVHALSLSAPMWWSLPVK